MKKTKLIYIVCLALIITLIIVHIGQTTLNENKISRLFEMSKNEVFWSLGKGEETYSELGAGLFYKNLGIFLLFDDSDNKLVSILPYDTSRGLPSKLFDAFGVYRGMGLQQIEDRFGTDKLREKTLDREEYWGASCYEVYYQMENYILMFAFDSNDSLLVVLCISYVTLF